MAKPLVSDELWEIVQPLLPAPKPPRFRNPGRKPLDDRKAPTGTLFVLKSDIPAYQVRGRLCWRRCETGSKPECGKSSTKRCCPDCTVRSAGTGPGLAWTARQCGPWAAGKNRP